MDKDKQVADVMARTEIDELLSPSPSPTTSQPRDGLIIGTTLNSRYLIERELGRGGIGAVYLARDQQLLGKYVVVKILLDESLQDEWLVNKFQHEMEALTRVEHPGIIGVLDASRTPDGRPFLVMQYVDGTNLRAALKPGEGMELERVASIMRQISEALSAAHEVDVLHRDLKPENIMLRVGKDGREQVKLIDFGLAKVRNSVVAPSTVMDLRPGTVAYMSPEQLNAKPLTTASDIYTLGVIAYEMITGRRPFTPDSLFQLGEMQKEGVRLKPKDLRYSLSEAAQAVVLKALAYLPKDRYQSAKEFGDGLWRTLTEEAGQKETEGRPAMEIGHVLFTDIVGYSSLPIDEQTAVLDKLQKIVRSTTEFIRAQLGNQLIRLPTGDGMALVYFNDLEAPVRCALEISKALKSHPQIKLRMGVHSGPVNKITDVNDKSNVAGAGINMAQRVMDCGDAGHILLSKRVADDLRQHSHWPQHLHDLGEAEVKHGVRIHVVNLYLDEVGNPELPAKFKITGKASGKRRLPRRVVIAAAVVLTLMGLIFLWGWRNEPGKTADGGASSSGASAPERMLNYWVEVQKYRNGNPDKDPFRLASEMVFQAGDHVWFNFTSPQAGYLYMINEGPQLLNNLPQYNVLFPQPAANNSSSSLVAGQTVRIPGERGFKIDDERGTEKIWVIWSARRVDKLEGIAREVVTPAELGVIGNPDHIKFVQAFIATHTKSQPKVARDEERKLTTVQAGSEVLVTLRTLEHY